jgi:phosphatidylcholine synthase
VEHSASDAAPIAGWSPSRRRKAAAWGTHLFTATGALWGFLALLAINDQQWLLAFAWMSVALFVDGFDGTIARRVRIKETLPNFDGALLDNLIDYFTYAIVPAYFLYEANILPANLRFAAVAAILLASAYQFCQADAKTDDHYFKGFPDYWNVLVLYLLLLNSGPWVSLGVTLLCVVLVFVPIHYIYPSRSTILRKLTLTLTCLWGLAMVALLSQYPDPSRWLLWGSLLYVVYYFGLSLYATFRKSTTAPSAPIAGRLP